MQNLEQKFQCPDLAAAEARAVALGAADAGIIRQHDLFFDAPLARLKLRLMEGAAELISYRRADGTSARTSEYHLTPVAEPQRLIATLTQALGPPRALKKVRHLYLWRATRIHLDAVEGLGTFVELETVISTQTMAEAELELAHVVYALGLTQPISTAYIDLVVDV